MSALTPLSIVVPTYREAGNIPELIRRIELLKPQFSALELLILDDNSQDGTEDLVHKLNKDWVKLIVRKTDRGLSPAVIEGLKIAQYDNLLVMDADGQHPAEVIPQMVQKLQEPAVDFVMGSRYVKGASIHGKWTFFRYMNSKVSTLLARPFVRIKDPMSGFFCLKRATFQRAQGLNPIGYKIGLELIVKCGCQNAQEIPIHFGERFQGESKLSLKEQLKYLRHIKRLADYKFGNASFFMQFIAVGALGVLVNLAFLTFFQMLDIELNWAVGLAIFISLSSNFALNRLVTFSHSEKSSLVWQYLGFVAACSVGAVINYFTTMALIENFPSFETFPQIPAFVGIVAGTGFNFITSRFVVFRRQAGNIRKASLKT